MAFFESCIPADRIHEHYITGTVEHILNADRLFSVAASRFEAAMKWDNEDREILQYYAEALCAHAAFDFDREENERAYRAKLDKAIECGCRVDRASSAYSRTNSRLVALVRYFRLLGSPEGTAQLLKALPNQERYGDIACRLYKQVDMLDKEYYKDHLYDLAATPSRFDLTAPGQVGEWIECGADMYR